MRHRLGRVLAVLALLCAPIAAAAQQLPAPLVRTQSQGDGSNRAASTNYVDLAAQTLLNAINTKAPIASPAFTGTPTAPTAPSGVSTTQLATTAFTGNAISALGITPAGSALITGSTAQAQRTIFGLDAIPTTTGSGTAYAVVVGNDALLVQGRRFTVRFHTAGTGGATTLAITRADNGVVGSRRVRRFLRGVETDPLPGDIAIGHADLIYDTAANGGSGAYILLSPPPVSPYTGYQLLTAASGTFVVPAGVTALRVTIQSEGGGGGGIANAVATAAGGGHGEYGIFLLTVTPGQSIAYTQGTTGGAGGAAGANSGANGSDTSFGPLTLSGGLGGAGAASGNATGNTLAATDASRHAFVPTAALQPIGTGFVGGSGGSAGVGGRGGNSLLGWTPVVAGTLNAAGTNATGYGGGGSGAGSATGSAALAGGNGAPGAIAINW